MNERFDRLEEAKRERIIQACLTEFAAKGYEQASTNEMVKRAGISKGLLFHYFGSKKALYLYLVDHAIEKILASYASYPIEYSEEIFTRLRQIGMVKLKLSLAYPEMTKVLVEAFVASPEDIRQEIQQKYAELYAKLAPPIFRGLDLSKFRPEVKPDKALEVLTMFLDALEQKYRKAYQGHEQDLFKDVEQIMAEYEEYFEILKYGMYVRE